MGSAAGLEKLIHRTQLWWRTAFGWTLQVELSRCSQSAPLLTEGKGKAFCDGLLGYSEQFN